jgi:urate oxidase
MVLLKTSRSGFSGFLRDALTTLPDTEDRLLGTAVRANWTYDRLPESFDGTRGALREAMLAAFVTHESTSVQQTLFAMGEAALAVVPEISAIDLILPNRHCLLVDLARFGQDNPNEIFVPTDEPHGTIEARVRRRR